MKNIVLSAVAVLAMSSFAVAGGDIAPVEEPIVVVEEPVMTDGGFYLGLAYSYMNATQTIQDEGDFIDDDIWTVEDLEINTGMLQVGYKFNSYVAVEGRYWFGGNDTIGTIVDRAGIDRQVDADIDTWGIYVKPMYPVTDAFDIYALLGYADNGYELSALTTAGDVSVNPDVDITGFSWGIGAAYSFNENFSLFVDYTVLYDDEDNFGYDTYAGRDLVLENEIDSINVGVTYKF